MTVHRINPIPGKFKQRKERDSTQKETVAERIKQMQQRHIAAAKIGVKPAK
jgi:hypothetical protein